MIKIKILLYFISSLFFIAIKSSFAVEIAPSLAALGNKLAGRFLPVFSSQPLKASEKEKKIVIIIHGLRRNAQDYFRMISEAAPREQLTQTLIIAPQFLNQKDMRQDGYQLPRGLLFWHKSEWKDGQSAYTESIADKKTSSFAVMDELLLFLKSRYPNTEKIVFASHSAGSQFLQRYAALTQIDSHPNMHNVKLLFLISDPSSYLYFDDQRPTSKGHFQAVDSSECPDANNYHYGLDNIIPYGAELSPSKIRQNYFARDIRYLLGTLDNNPNDPVMDTRCGAMMQGSERLERGLNYIEYLKHFGKISPVYLIEGADHDARHAGAKIFHSKIAKRLVFED